MTGFDAVALRRPASQLVTVFGGSGFLGRHVVRALAKRGYRVRVAVRRPDLAQFLQPLGRVGQIAAVQANLRFPDSIRRAVDRADVVVNLVGILQESGRQTFEELLAAGAGEIARACAAQGTPLVHVSAIGADPDSPSVYARCKAEGEAAVFTAVPEAIVMRPSVVFGPGDSFLNRFAALAQTMPVLPIAGAETRFQPVFAGDVAEAIAAAVEGRVGAGRVYECGGPEVLTLRALLDFVFEQTRRRALVVPLPFPIAQIQGRVMEVVDTLTLGLLPDMLKLTRDQVVLLQSDNVVSDAAEAEGRTLQGIGLDPTSLEAVAPSYLWRYRKAGQFADVRGDERDLSMPDIVSPVPGGPGSQHHPEDATGPGAGQRGAGAR